MKKWSQQASDRYYDAAAKSFEVRNVTFLSAVTFGWFTRGLHSMSVQWPLPSCWLQAPLLLTQTTVTRGWQPLHLWGMTCQGRWKDRRKQTLKWFASDSRLANDPEVIMTLVVKFTSSSHMPDQSLPPPSKHWMTENHLCLGEYLLDSALSCTVRAAKNVPGDQKEGGRNGGEDHEHGWRKDKIDHTKKQRKRGHHRTQLLLAAHGTFWRLSLYMLLRAQMI